MDILQMTSATDFSVRGHIGWGLGSYSYLYLPPAPPPFLGLLLLLFSVPSRPPPASWLERLAHASPFGVGRYKHLYVTLVSISALVTSCRYKTLSFHLIAGGGRHGYLADDVCY